MAPGGDDVNRDGDGEPNIIWHKTLNKLDVSVIVGLSGTSIAAPHVSATVTMMMQVTRRGHRCGIDACCAKRRAISLPPGST